MEIRHFSAKMNVEDTEDLGLEIFQKRDARPEDLELGTRVRVLLEAHHAARGTSAMEAAFFLIQEGLLDMSNRWGGGSNLTPTVNNKSDVFKCL